MPRQPTNSLVVQALLPMRLGFPSYTTQQWNVRVPHPPHRSRGVRSYAPMPLPSSLRSLRPLRHAFLLSAQTASTSQEPRIP
jgi:hypothetical protein